MSAPEDPGQGIELITESAEDAELARVLDGCLAAVETGAPVDVERLLAEHAALAPRLRACLAGLGLVEREGRTLTSHADRAAVPLPQFSDYRILRQVGQGGMGIVYEAEQISLGRRVALKVLPFAATLDPRQMQRFKNEAHAAAHLHHTNVVPVFAVGCERGVHFYVMQFIEGHNLDAVLRDMRAGATSVEERAPGPAGDGQDGTAARLSTLCSSAGAEFFRTVARLGLQAAEALDHAHQQGVIHRDIKPANLLLDAGRNLWITDFGLAQIRGDSRLTQTGMRVGTLRYMSPEQAMARRGEVDHRTDIYALGATLYELLTLRPAFEGADAQELLRHIALDDPAPPRQVRRAIPVELEIIVLKALAKEPAERYATAQDMADDLRRYLEDRPIQARRPSLRERLTKWARRHRTVVRTALVFLFLAVVALAGTTLLVYQAKEQAESALKGEQQARSDLEVRARELDETLQRETEARNALEAEKQKLLTEQAATRAALAREQQASYRHSIALANQEWWAGRTAVADQLLDDCPAELRNWEWRYLSGLRANVLKVLPEWRQTMLWRTAISADGTRLAAAGVNGHVYVWDVATGRELCKLDGLEAQIHSLAFSPDGQRLAAANGVWLFNFKKNPLSAVVKVWDIASGQELHKLEGRCNGLYQVAFSGDGKHVAAAGADGVLRVWDTERGAEVHVVPAHQGAVYVLAFLADGKHLVTLGSDGRVKRWDLASGFLMQEGAAPKLLSHSLVALSPDGRWIAVGAPDHTARLVNVASGREFRTLFGHTGRLLRLAFSADSRLLATASADLTARVWDVATGQEKRVYRGHSRMVSDVAFADAGQRLVTLAYDGLHRIWDTGTHQFVRVLTGHAGEINSLAFSPDSRQLASASADKSIRVWDVASGKTARVLPGHDARVEVVAFHPLETSLASVAADQSLRLWDVAAGRTTSSFGLPGNSRDWKLAFSGDGKRLLVATSADARLFDVGAGQMLSHFKLHSPGHHVVVRADSLQLASFSKDAPLTFWDTATGNAVHSFAGFPRCVSGAFSHDGRLFASCHAPEIGPFNADWLVRLWDTASGQHFLMLRGKLTGLAHLAFTRDGSRLASAEADGSIRLWEVRTGHELLRLRGLGGPFRAVAFSPDGRFLAAADSRQVLVWNAGVPSN